MPQQAQNKMKATSPSKLIQHGIDQSWGQQQKGNTNPKAMIGQQFNKNPMPVAGCGKKK